ncbi:alpha/beta fold hydrolase [Microdochium nivale]|nr:alpha/beta fold hydrolase [Microdochium nivale]
MIGTSFPELVFIRTSIVLLRYTTLLIIASLLLQALLLRPASLALTTWYNRVLIGYAGVDLLYYAAIWVPYQWRLRRKAKSPAPLSREERRRLLEKCLDNMPDPVHYLRMWFLGADSKDIRRDNVREFVLWAFFDKGSGAQSEEEEEELDEYVELVGDKMHRTFAPGRGKAECLRLSIDSVHTAYRTVGWYFIVGMVDMMTHALLAWQGFRYHALSRSMLTSVMPWRLQSLLPSARSESKKMAYWHRPHTAPDKIPIVFLHGIGIGLWPYVPFFSALAKSQPEDAQIGVIAIEMLPISMRITSDPLQKLEYLQNVTAILDAHGWSRFTLVTHSYGSAVASHVFSSLVLGPRVEATVMIDPVSIMLHLPDVAFNFTRRQPKRANEWMLWYFASMDPGVAHCLGRHFHWKESIAWKDDLLSMPSRSVSGLQQRRVAVCLAEQDLIVDTLAVARYLTGDDKWRPSSATLTSVVASQREVAEFLSHDGIEVAWFPRLDHAQVFDSASTVQQLCRIVQRYCSADLDRL